MCFNSNFIAPTSLSKGFSRGFTTSGSLSVDKRKRDVSESVQSGPSKKKMVGENMVESTTEKVLKENIKEDKDLNPYLPNIVKLENQYEDTDWKVTSLLEEVAEHEADIDPATPDTGSEPESETQLGKYIGQRTLERINLSDKHSNELEGVISTNIDHGRVKLLQLDHIMKSTKHDLNTVKVLSTQVGDDDANKASQLLNELKNLEKEQLLLRSELYAGNLPSVSDDGVKPSFLSDKSKTSSESGSNQENNNDGSSFEEEYNSKITNWLNNINSPMEHSDCKSSSSFNLEGDSLIDFLFDLFSNF